MEQSKQLVSIELAERMRELGFSQKSVFVYWTRDGGRLAMFRGNGIYAIENQDFDSFPKEQDYTSAYTVAELGEMLWQSFEKIGWSYLYKAYGEVFNFKGTEYIGELGIVNLMRKPDMAAKILIYLAEQGIINPKEIKI